MVTFLQMVCQSKEMQTICLCKHPSEISNIQPQWGFHGRYDRSMIVSCAFHVNITISPQAVIQTQEGHGEEVETACVSELGCGIVIIQLHILLEL